MREDLESFCPRFHRAVELVGARWNGVILRAMLTGRQRFSEIRDTIPGMSDRMLSQRLKQLEREGVVTREVVPDTPVQVVYHLTDKGRELEAAVTALADWAETWVEAPDDAEDLASA